MQSIVLIVCPPIFAGHIPTLDIAGFIQAPPKGDNRAASDCCNPAERNPITGIAACCACAAIGPAAAAPPSNAINSRRLTSGMGSPSEPAVPAYRSLRLPRKVPAGPWDEPELF